MTVDQWLEKLIPGIPTVVTGLISVGGIILTQRRADRRAKEAEERADARAREAEGRQKEQLNKAVLIDKHSQLNLRLYQLSGTHGEDPQKFEHEMRQWLAANRFYFDDTVSDAFFEAIGARHMLDLLVGDDPVPEIIQGRMEALNKIENAAAVVRAHAPRYGS